LALTHTLDNPFFLTKAGLFVGKRLKIARLRTTIAKPIDKCSTIVSTVEMHDVVKRNPGEALVNESIQDTKARKKYAG
jgi:hypothetical protein